MTELDFTSSPINSTACGASCQESAETKGFSGFMAGVNLADLIQLACLESKDRQLIVLAGHQSGQIFFSKGEVVHCEAGDKSGEDAFYEILCWEQGTFKFLEGTTDIRSVETPWNFLLIEALRRKDESKAKGKDKSIITPEVLIVDDSKFFVSRLRTVLQEKLDAKIVGEASNGREALDYLSKSTPSLVTLDINMPVMAGDVALKHIMIKSPAPVVLISTFNESQAGKIMEFFRLGAVDFLAKPKGEESWDLFANRLGKIVKNADKFQIKNVRRARNPKPASKRRSPGMPADKMVVVVGGYGGLLELQKILPSIDLLDRCGLVVYQEMCPFLVAPIANYLEPYCPFSLNELGSCAPLLSNQAWLSYIGGKWKIKSDESGAGIYCVEEDCKFDIGEALESLATIFSNNLAVVVLSGADISIAQGLQHVAIADGKIIVQRPESGLLSLPLMQLDAMGLTTDFMTPEDIAPFLTKWIKGEL